MNFYHNTDTRVHARESHGMAATVLEGTAPKLVEENAGKPFPIASNTGDSRKDGTIAIPVDLPERFKVIVSEWSLVTTDQKTLAVARDLWASAKTELLRRNYTIYEGWDESLRCFIAMCSKKPDHFTYAHP